MSRHVKLRYYTDAAIPSVRHDLPHFSLRVELAIRSHGLKLWVAMALSPESLIVAEMPMEDIQLNQLHRIQFLKYLSHRLKMPGRVKHQPTPGKTRLVSDSDCIEDKTLLILVNQLKEGLHPSQHTERIGRCQRRPCRRNFQCV